MRDHCKRPCKLKQWDDCHSVLVDSYCVGLGFVCDWNLGCNALRGGLGAGRWAGHHGKRIGGRAEMWQSVFGGLHLPSSFGAWPRCHHHIGKHEIIHTSFTAYTERFYAKGLGVRFFHVCKPIIWLMHEVYTYRGFFLWSSFEVEHPQGIHLCDCLHRELYVKGLGFRVSGHSGVHSHSLYVRGLCIT